MRSVLSLMAEFGSPTMLKPGKPLVKVLSTSMIHSSSPKLTLLSFFTCSLWGGFCLLAGLLVRFVLLQRLNLAFCHSFLPFGQL